MIEGIKFWFSRDLYNLMVFFVALIVVGVMIGIAWAIAMVKDKRKKRRNKDDR